MVDILIRRRQNNPILTGEAGVGKTAVVEGLALRIAQGDVPPVLKNVVLRTLDLGLLQAGAGVKGEFENRLKQVIAEVKASPVPIILFIDEAHTMIGAGGQAGQSDAANLLKPALARGELRTIAATTWAEYKKYFEKDAALARRFQVVKVEEPDEDRAIRDDARDHRDAREAPRRADPRRGGRERRSSSRTATSRAGSSRTSRSACSTPPAPAWRSARTRSRRPSRTAAAGSTTSRSSSGILDREERHRRPARRADRRDPAGDSTRPRPGWPRSRRGGRTSGAASRRSARLAKTIEARYLEEKKATAGDGVRRSSPPRSWPPCRPTSTPRPTPCAPSRASRR